MAEVNSLLDDVTEALVTGKGFLTQDPRATQVAYKVLSRLKAARAFHLDDSFTKTATAQSVARPEEMLNLWQSARPPYPAVWVEFSEQLRAMEQQRLKQTIGGEPLIDRTGYLIEQDATDPARWTCNVFFRVLPVEVNFPLGRLGLSTLAFVVDTEKHCSVTNPVTQSGIDMPALMDLLHKTSGDAPERMRHAAHAQLFKRCGEMFVEAVVLGRGWLVNEKFEGPAVELVRRIALTRSATYSLVDWAKYEHTSLAKRLTASVVTIEGDPRFAVTVLGLLQQTRYESTAAPREKQSRFLRGHRVKYMEQHVLTIVAPKERIVTPHVPAQGHGATRRAHEVIGHWCYRLADRIQAARCPAHHWFNSDPDHPNRQTCSQCGWQRWWRRACQRGDAGVGFVDKDYRVIAP